jgi:hypothetical protein
MFKKIHSNRDPRDTVFSELKKEYAAYFGKVAIRTRAFTERHPKRLFGAMVFCIAVSAALSFTVFRKPLPLLNPASRQAGYKTQPKKETGPVSDGFGEILQLSSVLKETIALKKEVDSISAKKTLDNADSTILLKDLDRLRQINRPKGTRAVH